MTLQQYFLVLLNLPFPGIQCNSPDDKSDSPIIIDLAIEIFNQLSTYISKTEFKNEFWNTEPFLKMVLPK